MVPVGFDVSQRQRQVSIRVVAPSGIATTYNVLLLRFGHQAYVKPSNQGGYFGRSVALSSDGATLAVAAHDESSGAVGVDGYGATGAAIGSGAVYVFHRDDAGVWKQEAFVKASNPNAFDNFGWSIALSGDGGTLAVGALNEDSNARGINGDQANNSAMNSGAAYVFRRAPTGKWSQEAYVKAPTPRASDFFGGAVALSYDGAALAVSGKRDAAAAERPNAVFVFRRAAAGTWAQEAALEAVNSSFYHFFGAALAFSKNGTMLAVGDPGEDGRAVGVNGPYSNPETGLLTNSGAVYVFLRSASGAWSQEAYVKASNTGAGDSFGTSVALSSDGATLAVGAPSESSNATGVGGEQGNDSASFSGAAYVCRRGDNGAWAQKAYVKASNAEADDEFGGAVALSGDGSVLAVGARLEDSNARGIGGAQTNAGLYFDAGAVYVYRRSAAGSWVQVHYVKASNTGEYDSFGSGVALSGDGRTIAVGARAEGSAATGIDGDQTDDTATNSGAVYVLAL